MNLDVDYIIVGSGSAGCAIAYRLSENGKYNVLVIEAGGGDGSSLIQISRCPRLENKKTRAYSNL